ncbi:hypothetical protein L198_07357 [Cryptococcus wingfieldii CBS 7118]|uniref:Uncharacterized protein n=1 Tax=Cryptococcus wingfieldii CBS 7118 TaxID=1295528 RepID=A0A1E3ICW7_9TREE|nr:hypothetical protein L198_07357 [Cryptococcus wingfieldii CBS 7118]ODN86338.1 hypothetical protein L198_07357 [Cryptococcus wingfieldii CBS 7118]
MSACLDMSERNHGRTHLLSQLTACSRKKKLAKPSQPQTHAAGAAQAGQERRSRKGLALVYEVIEAGEDEDSAPPLSLSYPPSSHPKPAQARPQCFARKVSLGYCRRHSPGLDETTVNGELDLFTDDATWASEAGERGEVDERLQSHLQHYTELSPAIVGTTTYAVVGLLLPLGSGTSTRSPGIPIVEVCAKTDLMDNAAEDVEQALRTVCLAYGAALFDTAPTQPTTYALLKSYLLHRLYTVPPLLNLPPTSPNTVSAPAIIGCTKFPFNHRANVLDRVAVMVPQRMGYLSRYIPKSAGQEPEEDDGEPFEEFLQVLLPSFASPPPQSPSNLTTVTEPSQNFFSRLLDLLMKDPNRDSHQYFRHAPSAISPSNVPSATNPGAGGFNNTAVGPMGGAAEGLSLQACLLKDKFARLGKKDGKAAPGTLAPAMPNEALHNFFQFLLANRSKMGGSAAGGSTKGTSAEGAGEGK